MRDWLARLRNELALTGFDEPPLTLAERLERIATDSLFRIGPRLLAARRLEGIPETSPFEAKRVADRILIPRERAWRFGRPLKRRAMDTYRRLAARGMTRRDLRLVVFCGYVDTDDGVVRVRWTKERVLEGMTWTLAAVNLAACGALAVRLHAAGISLVSTFLLALGLFFLITLIDYPLLLLGMRAPRVARRLQEIELRGG